MKQAVKFSTFLACTTLFKLPAATEYLHLGWIRCMGILGQDVELRFGTPATSLLWNIWI